MASDPGRPRPPPSPRVSGRRSRRRKQRLLKLLPERPSHERSEVTHNAILERDTIQHHAASPFCCGGVTGLVRGARVHRRPALAVVPHFGFVGVLTQSSRRTRPGQTIDPIVSCPAPPPAPTVVMRARCRSTSRHQGGSFVPPWKGGTWRHTPAAGGACGGLAIAARETRTPQCEPSRAAFPRLALLDRSTLAHAWRKREGLIAWWQVD